MILIPNYRQPTELELKAFKTEICNAAIHLGYSHVERPKGWSNFSCKLSVHAIAKNIKTARCISEKVPEWLFDITDLALRHKKRTVNFNIRETARYFLFLRRLMLAVQSKLNARKMPDRLATEFSYLADFLFPTIAHHVRKKVVAKLKELESERLAADLSKAKTLDQITSVFRSSKNAVPV